MNSNTDSVEVTPEEIFEALFPDRAIPAHLLQQIELFNEVAYIPSATTVIEKVYLTDIVGTSHPRYGDRNTWLQMITHAKNFSFFKPENFFSFLRNSMESISLVRIGNTERYYITNGNHRIAAQKIAGYKYITCKVNVVIPKNDSVIQKVTKSPKSNLLSRIAAALILKPDFGHQPAASLRTTLEKQSATCLQPAWVEYK